MPKASVLTGYGPPDVFVWKETEMPQPGAGQVRIRVRAAGVGPTDAKIRRGDLQAVFPLPPEAVLGFEAAGVVDALGPSVTGVKEGDEVAVLLAGLGAMPSMCWRRHRPSNLRTSLGAMRPPSRRPPRPRLASCANSTSPAARPC